MIFWASSELRHLKNKRNCQKVLRLVKIEGSVLKETQAMKGQEQESQIHQMNNEMMQFLIESEKVLESLKTVQQIKVSTKISNLFLVQGEWIRAWEEGQIQKEQVEHPHRKSKMILE